MFLILYAAWFIFNGRITGEIALIGLPICALLYWFTCAFLGNSPKKEWRLLKKLGTAISYCALLVKEVVQANLSVMRLILSPKYVVEPEIRTFTPALRTETARTILADSITLTPGTITVDMRGNELTVHCLDKSLAQELENSVPEVRLRKLEG